MKADRPKTPPVYKLMARRCDECLTTKRGIVPGARAAQIVRDCRAEDVKFICHKTTDAACRGVHEITGGCRAYRFAKAVGITVSEIEPPGVNHD